LEELHWVRGLKRPPVIAFEADVEIQRLDDQFERRVHIGEHERGSLFQEALLARLERRPFEAPQPPLAAMEEREKAMAASPEDRSVPAAR
jgi:hypothetical protein